MRPPDLGLLGIHVLGWYILIVLNTVLQLRMGRHLGLIEPLKGHHLRLCMGCNKPLKGHHSRESHLLRLRQ